MPSISASHIRRLFVGKRQRYRYHPWTVYFFLFFFFIQEIETSHSRQWLARSSEINKLLKKKTTGPNILFVAFYRRINFVLLPQFVDLTFEIWSPSPSPK